MTNDDKLDLLLEKVMGMEADMSNMKNDISNMKNDISDIKLDVNDLKAYTRKLNRNDELILDEVERVHGILNRHINDTKKHIA